MTSLSIRSIAVVTVLMPLSLSAQSQSPTASQLFQEGKFKLAQTVYRSQAAKDPQDIEASIGLLRTDLRLDNWHDAVEVGDKLVATFPRNADASGLYSLALMRAGHPDAATRLADMALNLDARSYWALIASSRVNVWLGHLRTAIHEAQQAVSLNPSGASALYYLLDAQSARDVVPASMPANAIRYFALKPKGHPHEFVMRALPGRMPILQFEVDHPPFQVLSNNANSATAKQTGDVRIPFTMAGGSIVVKCEIDNVPARLLFDTGGGSDITLNNSVALRLNRKPMAHSVVYGVSGYEPVDIYMARRLAIGSTVFGPVAVEGVKKSVPGEFDGILGGAAFLGYSVTIDFATHVIEMSPNASTPPPPPLPGDTLISLPFNIMEGDIVIRASVHGHSGYFILDTGDDEDGTLAAWLGNAIAKDMKPSEFKVINLNARVGLGTTATAQQIRLFNKPLSLHLQTGTGAEHDALLSPSLAANLVDTQISPADDFEVAGLIGIGVIRRFRRVTIDYIRQELTLEVPKPKPQSHQ